MEDIIIRVIELLYDDLRPPGNLRDLRSCALTHRAFTRTSQRYIFHTIRLGKEPVVRRLQSIFAHSPFLALDVRDVALDLWTNPNPALWPVILCQLRKATALDISGPPSSSAPQTDNGVWQAIAAISFLPNIDSLSISRITFWGHEQLALRLCATNSIRHVSFFECMLRSHTRRWPPDDEMSRLKDLRLESITITAGPRDSYGDFRTAFMSWLTTTSSMKTLRCVTLSPTYQDNVLDPTGLSLASFSALRDLQLNCCWGSAQSHYSTLNTYTRESCDQEELVRR
jgi:hypothetical protein